MKNILLTLSISILALSQAIAQNETNVQDISQYFTGGTARGISLNGAYGALGGDMTSLSINPAGLGVYRSSEFVFTPSFSVNNVNSTYYGKPYEDTKNKMNISNMGLVFSYNSNASVGWVGLSFGIAYNRLIDFNKNITIQAQNVNTSLLDEFVYNANNNNYSDFYEDLAYKTFAIDQDNQGYFSDFDDSRYYQQYQRRMINTNGGVGEYAFSLGANYSNKLYLGATIGVQRMRYEESKIHEESNIQAAPNTPATYLNSFKFYDNYNSYGTGYNFKMGAIYRPIELVRLGFAFHTPTFYNIESEFDTEMSTVFNNTPPGAQSGNLNFRDYTETQVYDFNVTSPLKMIFSGALQNQFGLISVDYEYVDYSKSKIRGDDDPFTDVNQVIKQKYRQTYNLKLGAELRLDEFSLRGGYGYYGSPYYSGHINKDANTYSYSFGVGYRGESLFIDLGYIAFNTKYKSLLYSSYDQAEFADLDTKLNRFVLTVGFKF